MPSFEDSVKGAISSGTTNDGNVTTSVASSNMKVASSVFETGAKDAITVVDRYGKRVVSDINQQVGGLKGRFDSFLDSSKVFSLTKSTLKSIASAASSALKAVNNARKQIESYTGLNLSSIGAAKASLKNAAIKTLSNVSGVNISKVMHDGEDLVRIARNVDVSSVNGLFNSVNRLLGNDLLKGVVDLQTEAAIFGSLLTEAAECGVLKVFDALWDKVKDADDKCDGSTAFYSAANSIPAVVRNGDLEMLERLVKNLGGATLLEQYPTVFTEFLRYYRVEDGKDVKDYPAIRSDIERVFNSIDPTWAQYEANGVTVYRLDPFIGASRDAKAVFQLNCIPIDTVSEATVTADLIGVSSVIASRYTPQHATTLLRGYYPNIPYA